MKFKTNKLKQKWLYFKQRHISIQKFNPDNNQKATVTDLSHEIDKTDKEINQIIKELFQLYQIRIRAIFKSETWLNKIQKHIYLPVIKESTSVYTQKLFRLHARRRILINKRDKLTGKFYQRRIQRFLRNLMLIITTILTIWIICIGIITAIYIIPILIGIYLFFSLFKNTL